MTHTITKNLLNKVIPVRYFSTTTQKLINWFIFFLAFPSIELLGNSITFYLFIVIAVRTGSFWANSFKGKALLFSFLVIALISTFVAPHMPRHPGIFASVKILIQYTYWVFVSIFFITQKKRIDYLQLSKWIFYGIMAATFCFYFFSIKFGSSVFSIDFGASRNAFVFNLLCTIPISFYFIIKKWGTKSATWAMPVYIMIMLLTGGRSGAILIILQMMLILSIVFPSVQKTARVLIPFFGLIYVVTQSISFQIYLDVLANQVEYINPRFANLLRGEEDGDLSADKSWLVRKLMVDKGIEIFKDYPILGIGPSNFNYYDSELATLGSYQRLSGQNSEFFNSRSAHNSYIELLSETGILGLSLVLSLLLIPLIFFFKRFFFGKLSLHYLPLISLLGIVMHFYAISAFTGAIGWLIIGLSWDVYNNNKNY